MQRIVDQDKKRVSWIGVNRDELVTEDFETVGQAEHRATMLRACSAWQCVSWPVEQAVGLISRRFSRRNA